MVRELGRHARELAKSFPEGNPERQVLEAHALLLENWSERDVQVKRFSPEAKQALEKDGWILYELSGKSINFLKAQGKQILIPSWLQGNSVLDLPSRSSEVAFCPDKQRFFLEGSFRKTEGQQDALFVPYAKSIEEKISGVRIIKGDGPDYIELVFKHSQDPEERLFGEKYNLYWTRTGTKVGHNRLLVGNFDDDWPEVNDCHPDNADDDLGLVPLAVPA